MNKSVKVSHGEGGWGGPLVLSPNGEKKYVLSVTTGGIHPVAKKIGEMTDAEVIDQFTNPVDTSVAFCVVIDCAGVARCGTYPKLGHVTIKFDGSTTAELPGTIYVKKINDFHLSIGDSIEII